MSERQRDPFVGKVLNGRFELVAPLGAGGSGGVYRAVQHPLGRDVAVKVLNPRVHGTSDHDFEERFFLEAVMAAKLKHPNTISLHDYGRTEEGLYFIAMELLEGETLQRVLVRNGPLPWPRALSMGAQVARSLREAHKLGLVHGDLSPAAIMMLSEGPTGDLVKVLDFGMARRTTGPAYRLGAANRLELTPAGEQLGSFLYMAPERARSELDPRGDLYSLGAVLFMAIAGRTPFLGQRPAEVLAKHLRERPPELRDFVEVPDELNRLVLRCLEKVPEARFASADELLDAIRAAATGSGVASLFADVGPRASPRVPVPPPLPSKRPLRRALSGRLGAWRSAWRGAPGQPRPWWSRLLRRR